MCDSANIADRICLGTAQLGMDYGVANRRGRPDDAACVSLLSGALERNIVRWDTARAYGDAERRIGQFLRDCSARDDVRMISKLQDPPPGMEPRDLTDWVTNEVTESLRTLGVERLADLLIHNAATVRRYGTAIWDAMIRLVELGLVEQFGLSVYDEAEFELALAVSGPTSVQLPCNIVDHRLTNAELFDKTDARELTIYARSVLWQGVLAMTPSQLPRRLQHLVTPLRKLHETLAEFEVDCLDIALPFVLTRENIDYVVIGVDDVSQLDDTLSRANLPMPIGLAEKLHATFGNLPATVLEPRRW